MKQMEQGEIDLAFHVSSDAPDSLRRRSILTERYVLVGRAEYPRLRKRPTLSQFCQLDHVTVSPDGGGFHGITDQVLSELGLTRRVVFSVPHFLFLTSVLASTDLVAMMPFRLVRDSSVLRVVEPPIDIPGFEILMLWHERVHRDPAHQWLREHIVKSI